MEETPQGLIAQLLAAETPEDVALVESKLKVLDAHQARNTTAR